MPAEEHVWFPPNNDTPHFRSLYPLPAGPTLFSIFSLHTHTHFSNKAKVEYSQFQILHHFPLQEIIREGSFTKNVKSQKCTKYKQDIKKVNKLSSSMK
jgi:hypothetical protein